MDILKNRSQKVARHEQMINFLNLFIKSFADSFQLDLTLEAISRFDEKVQEQMIQCDIGKTGMLKFVEFDHQI